MSGHAAELARIVAAVEVGPDRIVLGGRMFAPAGQSITAQLGELLYRYCYCAPFEGVPVDHAPGTPGDLTDALSRANAGRAGWQPGWHVVEPLPGGGLAAERSGTVRSFWPGQFTGTGDVIAVLVQRDSRAQQPGFYYAFGETLPDESDELRLVRTYWNVPPERAPDLVAAVTENLNRRRIPFQLKCLSDASSFATRADPLVVFLTAAHYRAGATVLADVHSLVARSLRARVPLLTKRVANGVGLAEDPGDGESFGLDRCRRIARAIVMADHDGARGADRLPAVMEHLRSAGLDVERPYLRPGADDIYPAWA